MVTTAFKSKTQSLGRIFWC